MAKSISVRKVKNALKLRHDEIVGALAFARAAGDTETADALAVERGAVLDIAKDLFGSDAYVHVGEKRTLAGTDCMCAYLVWREEQDG